MKWFIILSILYFVLAEGLILWLSRPLVLDEAFDVILVLGANGDLTSPVLRDRVVNAVELAQHHPEAKVLLTGNGERGELQALVSLFTTVSPELLPRITEESRSRTTRENVLNSKKLLKGTERVAIVTNEFHQTRAVALARASGLRASAVGRDSRSYRDGYKLTIREHLARLKAFPFLLYDLSSNRP